LSEREAVLPVLDAIDTHQLVSRLEDAVCRVIVGKRDVVRLAVVSMLARGHLLIEDVPGVGKTTLAQALARAVGLSFQRIQFTSDLLPSDIIGVSVFHQEDAGFRFHPGPLFAHVILADEINRATPKTQSALLEAMSEGRVSVDRKRYVLPHPFLVIATQNPLDHQGTFPLPESQLDRFLMSLAIGYPDRKHERALLLAGGAEAALEALEPVLELGLLQALQERVQQVRVAEKLADYMLELAEATRRSPDVLIGVSPRGIQGLYRAVQAMALCGGRDFATPDDVQALVVAVLGHRIVLRKRHGGDGARSLLQRLMRDLPVPV
jgi:MoxR-like ATPase